METHNYYYVLDFTKGCCDIFSGPAFESEYDLEDYLIEKGYDLDNIEYMVTDNLNYNIEGEVNIKDIDEYDFNEE